jgi:hypothetical protein
MRSRSPRRARSCEKIFGLGNAHGRLESAEFTAVAAVALSPPSGNKMTNTSTCEPNARWPGMARSPRGLRKVLAPASNGSNPPVGFRVGGRLDNSSASRGGSRGSHRSTTTLPGGSVAARSLVETRTHRCASWNAAPEMKRQSRSGPALRGEKERADRELMGASMIDRCVARRIGPSVDDR